MNPRYDSYLAIHKALRLFMCDTLTRIGRTDPADAAEVQSTLKQVSELMDLCTLHIRDENDFIHPALERARPGSAARIHGEHDHHQHDIARLRKLAEQAGSALPSARHAALNQLYRAMALFVAENFTHMHVEETEHNAVLWAHYSDDEILAVEHELVASIPPQAMMGALRWFLPSLNAVERTGMLRGMQAGMPPPVFEAVLDIARQTLAPGDFAKLARDLALPATPAPMAA